MIRPLLAALLLAWPAAAEVRLLGTGAFQGVAEALIARSMVNGGETVMPVFDTAGGALRRVRAGEAFDVVIITPTAIDGLIADGVLAGPRIDLARVGIGVAVPTGAPHPDISSEATLRATLLAARSVAIVDPAAGGSSGIYLAGLFERWGIMDAMAPKLVLVPGGRAATRLATGEASIALQQLSELDVPGAEIVGPLPDAVQNVTVYSAALRPAAPDAARQLLTSMTGPEAETVIQARGMQRP